MADNPWVDFANIMTAGQAYRQRQRLFPEQLAQEIAQRAILEAQAQYAPEVEALKPVTARASMEAAQQQLATERERLELARRAEERAAEAQKSAREAAERDRELQRGREFIEAITPTTARPGTAPGVAAAALGMPPEALAQIYQAATAGATMPEQIAKQALETAGGSLQQIDVPGLPGVGAAISLAGAAINPMASWFSKPAEPVGTEYKNALERKAETMARYYEESARLKAAQADLAEESMPYQVERLRQLNKKLDIEIDMANTRRKTLSAQLWADVQAKLARARQSAEAGAVAWARINERRERMQISQWQALQSHMQRVQADRVRAANTYNHLMQTSLALTEAISTLEAVAKQGTSEAVRAAARAQAEALKRARDEAGLDEIIGRVRDLIGKDASGITSVNPAADAALMPYPSQYGIGGLPGIAGRGGSPLTVKVMPSPKTPSKTPPPPASKTPGGVPVYNLGHFDVPWATAKKQPAKRSGASKPQSQPAKRP